MPILIAPQFTLRSYQWSAWKAACAAKAGVYQHSEEPDIYTIYFYDGPEAHTCTIWKGVVPDGVVQTGYAQSQNDADKTDFETNYKPTSNKTLVPTDGGAPLVASQKITASKTTFYTHNWCDPTTWYTSAKFVQGETASATVAGTTYQLANKNVIDTYHGKLTGEDYFVDSQNRSYRANVYVNGTKKVEQDPHYGSGGDYTINYATGLITFVTAIDVASVVTCDYHYATDSTFVVVPSSGKNLRIESADATFTTDVVINDSVTFQAYGLVDVFAPQLMPGVPSGTKIPLGNPLVYKTIGDYQSDAMKAYPTYPALGGQNNWRGLPSCVVLDWDYKSSTVLVGAYGMEVHVKLQHDKAMGGTYASATFYCLSETP